MSCCPPTYTLSPRMCACVGSVCLARRWADTASGAEPTAAVQGRCAVFGIATCVSRFLTSYVKGHIRRQHGRAHRVRVPVCDPAGAVRLRARPPSSSSSTSSHSYRGAAGDDRASAATGAVVDRFANRVRRRRGRPSSRSHSHPRVLFPEERDEDIRLVVGSALACVGVTCDWLRQTPSVLAADEAAAERAPSPQLWCVPSAPPVVDPVPTALSLCRSPQRRPRTPPHRTVCPTPQSDRPCQPPARPPGGVLMCSRRRRRDGT